MYCSLFLTVLVEFLAMSYILNAAVIWEEVWKVINMGRKRNLESNEKCQLLEMTVISSTMLLA